MAERRVVRTVGEEIRQLRPFRSRGQEALVGLLRTADDVRRFFGRVLEAESVTLQQYNVLRILRAAGDPGLPTLEIADRMIERTPGVTRIVDRLEAKGWVRRRRGREDRRQVFCRLTEPGLELLARLDAPIEAADEALLEGMDGQEIERLIAILDRLRAGIPREEGEILAMRSG